jgi:hypothetical protein
MSYNGSGTFNINTTGQPVVAGTVISSSAFNALTTDLATGLTTAITKDGQTTTTARITFAQGFTSSLTTDSSSVSTGSIITAGGAGIAKNLYVGVNANVAGTLGVTGVATFSAAPIYSSLTASSAVATDASKGLVSVTNTGTGNNVLATSPTLVTPILGTPQSGTLTNATGLPLSTGVTGTLPEANGGTGTTTGYYGFKNRLINGAMVIDQRNAGASITVSAGSTSYPVDRMLCYVEAGSSGTFTAQQSSSAPTGFKNSVLLTTATVDSSITATEGYSFQHRVEGYNVADLGWGAAGALSVTLSFWVKSSLTGTFAGSIANGSFNRSYVFNYTISSANTWEQKTVTITGDTGGTWNSTNGSGLIVYLSVGAGSNYNQTANAWGNFGYSTSGAVNVIGTTSANISFTGVQLEKGSTATSFDYRPYGTELQLCQRYYQKITTGVNDRGMGVGFYYTSSTMISQIPFQTYMRAAPTLDVNSGTNYFIFYTNNSNQQFNTVTLNDATPYTGAVTAGSLSGTSGSAGQFKTNNASTSLAFTAEL